MVLATGEIIALAVVLAVVVIITIVLCVRFRKPIARFAESTKKRLKQTFVANEEDTLEDSEVAKANGILPTHLKTVEDTMKGHSDFQKHGYTNFSNHTYTSGDVLPHSFFGNNRNYAEFHDLEKLQVELNTGPFEERYVGDESDEGGFLAAAGGSQRKPKALGDANSQQHEAQVERAESLRIASKPPTPDNADIIVGYVPGSNSDVPESLTCHTFPRAERLRRAGNKCKNLDNKYMDNNCTCDKGDQQAEAKENLQQTLSLRLERRPHKDGTFFGIVHPSGSNSLASTPSTKKRQWDPYGQGYHIDSSFRSHAKSNEHTFHQRVLWQSPGQHDSRSSIGGKTAKNLRSSSQSFNQNTPNTSSYAKAIRDIVSCAKADLPGTFPRSKSQERPSFINYNWEDSPRNSEMFTANVVYLDTNPDPQIPHDTFI